jgi:hypothetical protein
MGDERFKITESAELVDRVTNKKREVDVLIETEVAGHEILIAFECAARGRRPSVEWVEQMHGKHSTLDTNQLVLVSESGFSRPAAEKARALGIETVTPEMATDEIMHALTHRFTQVRFNEAEFLTITNVYVTLGATDTESREEGVHLLPAAGEMHVFTEPHRFIGTIKDVIYGFMASATENQPAVRDMFIEAPDDPHFFEVSVDGPLVVAADSSMQKRIYFEKLEPVPHLRCIEHLRIVGEAQVERSVFPLKGGIFRDIPYSWGESTMRGAPAVVVVTATSDEVIKITPKTY